MYLHCTSTRTRLTIQTVMGLPTPASDQTIIPPPSSTTLPNEVVARIIRHARDDLDTLAACMRVSSSFNHIAVPHLYRNGLVLKHHNPFSITSSSLETRLSADKATNLKRIRTVTVREHSAKRCPELHRDSRFREHCLRAIRIDHDGYPDDDGN